MKVYLDVCAIQRPLDTPSHLRIVLEAEAVLGILTLCEEGRLTLVASEALHYEIRKNPHPLRRAYALAVIRQAKVYLKVSEAVETRARWLVNQGFKPLDALHLALAEQGNVDYFCTTDDKLLKRAQRLTEVGVKVVSPLALVEEMER